MDTRISNAPTTPTYTRSAEGPLPAEATRTSAPLDHRADAEVAIPPALAHVLVPRSPVRPRRPPRLFSLDERMFVELHRGTHG